LDRILPPKNKWPLRLLFLLAILLFAGMLILSFAFSSGRKLEVDLNSLIIDTVRYAEFQEYIAVGALVIPEKTVYLEAVDGGRVEEIFVENGAVVKTGQPLLRLASPQMIMDVMNRESEYGQQLSNLEGLKLQTDRTTLEQQNALLGLELDLKRQRRICENEEQLFAAGMLSKSDYEQSREELDYLEKKYELFKKNCSQSTGSFKLQQAQLKSTIINMQKNLQIIRKIADNLLVRAPIDGQLGEFDMQIGQSKNRGEKLGLISRTDRFRLRAAVDEFYLSKLVPDLAAETAIEGRKIDLKISKIYPEVKNNAVKIELEFTGEVNDCLKLGQSLNLKIFLTARQKCLQIKNGTFYQDNGGSWIYVLSADRKSAQKRAVRIGRSNPLQFEIVSGLAAGETVVISGIEDSGDADGLIIQ